MTMAIYDVSKPHVFDMLVSVRITSSDFCVYKESYPEDIGISSTSPEFLGRLRKVTYEGGISKLSEMDVVPLEIGDKLLIKVDGSIGLMLSGAYYEIEQIEFGVEHVKSAKFPTEELGEYGEFYAMTEEGLAKYVNSFKSPPRKKSNSKGRSLEYTLTDCPCVLGTI